MNSKFRRAAAAALVLCMSTAALAGCSKKVEEDTSSKPMIKVGDVEVSQGATNLTLRYQQAQFESGWGGFLRSYYGDIWNSDLTGSGEPYGQTFIEQGISMVEEMALAKEHMADYGVELSDDEKAAIKKAAEEFIAANDEESMKAISATVDSAEEMLTLYTIRAKVNEKIAAEVDTEVSDEEAAQRTVSYVSFIAATEEETEAVEETESVSEEAVTGEAAAVSETEVKTQSAEETEAPEESVKEEAVEAVETEEETETEDPAMIEARAEAKAKAEAFLETAKSADDFDTVAAAAAEEKNVNNGSWTFGKDDTYPDAAIIAATEGVEDGTLIEQVFQSGNVFYVVYVKDAFDEDATAEKKEEIVDERKSEAVSAKYQEWAGAEDVEFDSEAISKYSFATLVYLEQETEEEMIVESEAVEAETGEQIAQ